jgi:hypothetical protein
MFLEVLTHICRSVMLELFSKWHWTLMTWDVMHCLLWGASYAVNLIVTNWIRVRDEIIKSKVYFVWRDFANRCRVPTTLAPYILL